jgi:hypothetical protein
MPSSVASGTLCTLERGLEPYIRTVLQIPHHLNSTYKEADGVSSTHLYVLCHVSYRKQEKQRLNFYLE